MIIMGSCPSKCQSKSTRRMESLTANCEHSSILANKLFIINQQETIDRRRAIAWREKFRLIPPRVTVLEVIVLLLADRIVR